jgi:hypothetical protein
MSPADLEALATELAKRLTPLPDFVDQHTSGVPRTVFTAAARAGEFPAVRMKRRWVARRSEVAAWFDRHVASQRSKRQPAPRESMESLRQKLGVSNAA